VKNERQNTIMKDGPLSQAKVIRGLYSQGVRLRQTLDFNQLMQCDQDIQEI
jgi:hypothetical protein